MDGILRLYCVLPTMMAAPTELPVLRRGQPQGVPKTLRPKTTLPQDD